MLIRFADYAKKVKFLMWPDKDIFMVKIHYAMMLTLK